MALFAGFFLHRGCQGPAPGPDRPRQPLSTVAICRMRPRRPGRPCSSRDAAAQASATICGSCPAPRARRNFIIPDLPARGRAALPSAHANMGSTRPDERFCKGSLTALAQPSPQRLEVLSHGMQGPDAAMAWEPQVCTHGGQPLPLGHLRGLAAGGGTAPASRPPPRLCRGGGWPRLGPFAAALRRRGGNPARAVGWVPGQGVEMARAEQLQPRAKHVPHHGPPCRPCWHHGHIQQGP
jgi:hypothetical protein